MVTTTPATGPSPPCGMPSPLLAVPLLLCLAAPAAASLLPGPAHLTPRELARAAGPPPRALGPPAGACLGVPAHSLRQLWGVLVNRRWPGGQVAYHLDPSLLPQDRAVVAEAMHLIQAVSCVRFVPYNPRKHLLSVTISRDCACNPYRKSCPFKGALASVGPLPHGVGRLVITGACLQPGTQRSVGLIIHELFHTLGFPHLQERADRDLHIKINWFNIELFSLINFKWNPWYKADGIPYDCSSLMHYDDLAFSNGAGPTMTARDPATCSLHKQSNLITRGDEALLRKAYNCDRWPVQYKVP